MTDKFDVNYEVETFTLKMSCFHENNSSIDDMCTALATYFDQLYEGCKPRRSGKSRKELLVHKCDNINRIRRHITSS